MEGRDVAGVKNFWLEEPTLELSDSESELSASGSGQSLRLDCEDR